MHCQTLIWLSMWQNVSPDEMSEHVSIPLWYVLTFKYFDIHCINQWSSIAISFALYKTCYPTEMSLLEEKLHDLKLLRNESVQVRSPQKNKHSNEQHPLNNTCSYQQNSQISCRCVKSGHSWLPCKISIAWQLTWHCSLWYDIVFLLQPHISFLKERNDPM